jgi:hypothetical protein
MLSINLLKALLSRLKMIPPWCRYQRSSSDSLRKEQPTIITGVPHMAANSFKTWRSQPWGRLWILWIGVSYTGSGEITQLCKTARPPRRRSLLYLSFNIHKIKWTIQWTWNWALNMIMLHFKDQLWFQLQLEEKIIILQSQSLEEDQRLIKGSLM